VSFDSLDMEKVDEYYVNIRMSRRGDSERTVLFVT
jgi:hypothetical protein